VPEEVFEKVFDGEAPFDGAAVGDSDWLIAADMVLVLEPVIDADTPNDFELVAVSVPDGVREPLHDGNDVSEEEAPFVADDVGVCVCDGLPDGNTVGLLVDDCGAPGDSVLVGVSVCVTGADCDMDIVDDGVLLAVDENDGDAPVVSDEVGVDVTVAVTDFVCVVDSEVLGVLVAVVDGVDPTVKLGVGVGKLDGVCAMHEVMMSEPGAPAPVVVGDPPTKVTPPTSEAPIFVLRKDEPPPPPLGAPTAPYEPPPPPNQPPPPPPPL
jgi:hypothetical protein